MLGFLNTMFWINPNVIWIAAGSTLIFSSGCFPSIIATMFLASTFTCCIAGLAALCAPESAISPTAKMLEYFVSCNWRVGRTRMKPLAGLMRESVEEGGKVDRS